MSTWFKKVTGILATVLTLGIINPTDIIHKEPLVHKEALPPVHTEQALKVSLPDHHNAEQRSHLQAPFAALSYDELSWQKLSESLVEKEELRDQFKSYMIYQANAQAVQKFGEHINQKIGEQYRKAILPQFEKVLEDISQQADVDLLKNVAITNQPASGLGEKILHLYDTRNGRDLVRFHVRRENPPKNGYWFNFHYHKSDDNFENHHELGKIYWDKNMPPRWAA